MPDWTDRTDDRVGDGLRWLFRRELRRLDLPLVFNGIVDDAMCCIGCVSKSPGKGCSVPSGI